MKVKGIARKSRRHWRETEMQENARAEREEPDSGNEKGKECEQTIHGKWLDGMGWKKDGQKGCKIDGNEGALMKKYGNWRERGWMENVWTIDGKFLENALME